MFSNFTWTKDELTVEEAAVLRHWSTKNTGVFVSLAGFIGFTVGGATCSYISRHAPTCRELIHFALSQFVFSIIASTIPVPSGSFIPVFKIGAALGRTVGELMHLWFPSGMRYGNTQAAILPG